MGFLTRRLTLKDLPVLLKVVFLTSIVVCLVLTMIRASRLETEVEDQAKQLQGLNRIEVVEQTGVLPFPKESRTPSGKVEFSPHYDSPPYITFTKAWAAGGPIPYDLPKDVQENMLNQLKELAEGIRSAFVVKAVAPDAFEWVFDSQRFGGNIPPDCKVFWKAQGLRVVPPR